MNPNESKWKQLNPSDVEVKVGGRTLIRAPKRNVPKVNN